MTVDESDAEIHAALAAEDPARLSRLYLDAANTAERDNDIDRACFFLTHAWIFALDAGDPMAKDLRARLVHHGREIET